MEFKASYTENIKSFDQLFSIGKNYDFISRELQIAERKAHFYFIDSFVNGDLLERLFLFFARLEKVETPEELCDFVKKYLPFGEVSVVRNADDFVYAVMSGTVGMLLDSDSQAAMILDVRRYPTRGIEQSENDRVLRGAHDSFVETIKQNSTLIRRRIRDPKLTFKKFTVGKSSKTDVVLAYIEGKADPDYVNELSEKLSSVKVDALTLGQQSLAECLIKRGWYDPFPKFRYTERPDAAAAQLLEGSVILLCDTSPEAMILPTCLFDFMQETDDYYFPPLVGSYLRIIRYFVFLLTMILTPTWYLFITHEEWLPSWLTFIKVEGDYALPIIFQLFLIEFAIDGLKLASMNTPNSLSNTFGIVGGLILGDFAIQIGWFVPEVIVYMAFVSIANFSQSSYELGYTFKLLRMLLLLLTALFGLVGYLGGFVLIVVLIATNRTVNGKRNYLYPLIPFNGKALKRLIIREKLKTADQKKK